MSGRQILSRSISLPPNHFNVLMIPSVAIVNANKKIMLPAMIAISRGFPAAVNSTGEKVLTRCLILLGVLRKLSATHTSLMSPRHSQSQKYITFMSAFREFSCCYYPEKLSWVLQHKEIVTLWTANSMGQTHRNEEEICQKDLFLMDRCRKTNNTRNTYNDVICLGDFSHWFP